MAKIDINIREVTSGSLETDLAQGFLDFPEQVRAGIAPRLEGGTHSFYVAEVSTPEGPQPGGQVVMGWKGPEREPIKNATNNLPAMLFLGVREGYRRQGIATNLVRHAASETREWYYPGICLVVAIGNTAAQALYAKEGFTDWGQGEVPATDFVKNEQGFYVPQEAPGTVLIKYFPDSLIE